MFNTNTKINSAIQKISYKTIKNNSSLIDFHGTKEMVIANSVSNLNLCQQKEKTNEIQSNLFQFK